jgi:hypothetical protein
MLNNHDQYNSGGGRASSDLLTGRLSKIDISGVPAKVI